MKTIDARGLSCPQPVLLTKKALEENNTLLVLVNDRTPLENIIRFCENSGYSVNFEENGDDFQISITK